MFQYCHEADGLSVISQKQLDALRVSFTGPVLGTMQSAEERRRALLDKQQSKKAT
jgi:hypothetical protein